MHKLVEAIQVIIEVDSQMHRGNARCLVWALSECSFQRLQSTVDSSVLCSAANDFDPAWTQLIDGVKTGQEPFKLHYGTDIWQYYKERPENEKMFSQAMVRSPFTWQHALC